MATRLRRALSIAGAIATLAGCAASLSENQCKANDWYTVGYSDGSQGFNTSRLLRHDDACLDHGIVPDRMQYTAGWNAGIQQFCTPENGFDLGERGASYNRVCPADVEPEFHAAYSNGRHLFIAATEVAQIESAIDQRSARIEEMQRDMQHAVDALIAPDTPTTDRLFLLERTKSLAQEQGKLRSEIERLNAEAAVKRSRLESLRQSLAYR